MERFKLLAVIEFGRNLMMDDSSDEEAGVLEKIDNYAEHTVPNMTNRQFQMHFRMSPTTFEDLLRKMNTVYVENNYCHVGYPRTSLEKEAMIMLWCLGNLESFRSVSERFGVSKATCWDVLYRTSNVMLKVNKKYKIIAWPSRERQREISRNFGNNGFPGIIGYIDGSHIRITAPKHYRNSYINRKNYHSVLLQGVCDHRMMFTDVYSGEAGSIHDYTLYKRSPLYVAIRDEQVLFHEDSHLIGDLAYKLESNLLVGYKNFGNLTPREKNFNKILSKSRVMIENSFALLKGRFRRLKLLETVRLDLISLLIVTCCIMHNICILNGDLLEDVINLDNELHEEQARNPHNIRDIDVDGEVRRARIKRQNICNALPMRVRQ